MGDLGGQACSLCGPVWWDWRCVLRCLDCDGTTLTPHRQGRHRCARLRPGGGGHLDWIAVRRRLRTTAVRPARTPGLDGAACHAVRPHRRHCRRRTRAQSHRQVAGAEWRRGVGRVAMWGVGGRLFSVRGRAGGGVALAASVQASSAEPQLLTRPAVFVHGIVVAFWIGALVPLAAVMRSPDRRAVELARFSRAIPTAIILVIASGISLAIVQLRQVDALWTTGYGLVLCGKLIAVVALLALAALNRYALTPCVVAGDSIAARRITRSIAAELLIAVLALAFVAAWRFTPPPRALLAAAEAPVHVHIHSDKAMADLTIEPAA